MKTESNVTWYLEDSEHFAHRLVLTMQILPGEWIFWYNLKVFFFRRCTGASVRHSVTLGLKNVFCQMTFHLYRSFCSLDKFDGKITSVT